MNKFDQILFDNSKKYSSFYVLDIERFKKDITLFLNSFKNLYNNTELAYSFKTNYIPDLCKEIKKQGFFAEVVSEMEYNYALKLKFEGKKIIYNGPNKTEESLLKAINNESIINVDSLTELNLIKSILLKLSIKKRVEVSIRLNFDNYTSRFGISENKIEDVFDFLNCNSNIVITGLHCHVMPKDKSHKEYKIITNKVLEIYKLFKSKKNDISFINMGGGYASEMPEELISQLKFKPSNFVEYANAIAGTFNGFFKDETHLPKLILEPGLAVVANCLKFYTKIVSIKKEIGVLVCDGSIYNIKPTKNKLNLPARVIRKKGNKLDIKERFLITGSTCMEDDILHNNFVECVKENDLIEFSNVGAYTIVLYPPFIIPQKAIFKYEKDQLMLIRKQSNLNSIFNDYICYENL